MAEGQGLFSGLTNLPVFEGVPNPERSRALLEAGLAMMQPQDPLRGTDLTQLTGGVSAGLQSLDRQRGERKQDEVTAFDQMISGRGADTADRGVDVQQQQADTGVLRQEADQTSQEAAAALGQDQLAQAEKEWTENGSNRKATAALANAKAKYWDRMPTEGSEATATSLKIAQHLAKMNQMWAADQALPITERRFLGKEDPQLIDEAWGALDVRQGLASSEALGIIATNTQDAAQTGQNVLAATDPNAATAQPQRTPESDAKANEMAAWTAEQWKAVRDGEENPEINQLLLMYPGIRARAIALLSE